MANYFEGMTEEQCYRVMNGLFKNDGTLNDRYRLDASLLMNFVFQKFWESVNTGEPVDKSWYKKESSKT
jgi:hypothetical protein